MVGTSASAQAKVLFSVEDYLGMAVVKHPHITWERVETYNGETQVISKLIPMQSAAGHYLGWCCTEVTTGEASFIEPWDRATGYYTSKELCIAAEQYEE